MRRLACLVVLALAPATPAADAPAVKPPPLVATAVTPATQPATLREATAALAKQAGFRVETTTEATAAKPVPAGTFWEVAEKLADAHDQRIDVKGNAVVFSARKKAGVTVPSSVDGPFRVVLRKVVARRDPDAATSEYEFHLEIQWEPRFPVYLMDAEPRDAKVAVGGKQLASEASSGRVAPEGFAHATVVRVKGVPRDAKAVDTLGGSFRVVAAAKWLTVDFKDLTGDKPVSQEVGGVAVTLLPAKRHDNRVEFGVDLRYPASHPTFESFEQYWASSNTFTLIAPNNRGVHPAHPEDSSVNPNGPAVEARYHFPTAGTRAVNLADLTGWRAVYRTPCPLVEETFRFELKKIELP